MTRIRANFEITACVNSEHDLSPEIVRRAIEFYLTQGIVPNVKDPNVRVMRVSDYNHDHGSG